MALTTIQKRLPADTKLDKGVVTFLNDSKIDGELYAFLQSVSLPAQVKDGYETRVYLKDLPTQKVICGKLGFKSTKTYRSHLQYLIDAGYVIDDNPKYYVLENREEMYLMVPLDTLTFLTDVLQEYIIKIYIYLGQRYKYAQSLGKKYEFTIGEVAKHIGLALNNNMRNYEKINNALSALMDFGLIEYQNIYVNDKPAKRLTNFSLVYQKN